MWRILTACLVMVSLGLAHHDGTDHHHHEDEHKALIMLEIQPNLKNGTAVKDKRSPQHQTSQAVFGASPGQFVVRTSADDSGAQGGVPPEYLSLLQQLVAQQHQGAGGDAQAQLPVINQLLVARNPDPTAVQFSNSPSQPQRPRRPPPSPHAQLQKLYFDRQFQQQIPVRPRILRPPPQPQQPSQSDFANTPTNSQVYNIHEARLRASLAGSDPNLAVQALTQQLFQTTASPVIDQQLTRISTPQEHLTELQSVPEPAISHQQVITARPQVQYVQQPVQRAASFSSSSRQAAPSSQLISAEGQKLSRRPAPAPAPEQYLRETTQPITQQAVAQVPTQQQTSDPKIYLASETGQQTPQDDDFIQQLLSGGGRGLFPSSTPSPADVAEELIKSTTTLPAVPSRSSIYVTQRSKLRNSPSSSKITIEDVGGPQEGAQTPLPVVHLPTPEGQRPLTQSEFQALINAGFNIQPVSEESQNIPSITPQYIQQPTTKRQRSYVTPAPPKEQDAYQPRLKTAQEAKEEVRYLQQVTAEEELTQRPQQLNTRYRLQGTKPQQQQQQEEFVQYVQRPAPQEERAHQSQSRFRIVVGNSEPEEKTIQFVQLPTASEDAQQKEQLSTYQQEDVRSQQITQLLRIQDERESLTPQVQTTRYQQEISDPQQTYQAEDVNLPQQTATYQGQEDAAPQQPRFQPIVVPDLPSTTPVSSSTIQRRRRPRPPTHSRIVYRTQAQEEDASNIPASPPQQFVLSYDNVPEASSFGTRSRVRARRPVHAEE